MQPHRKWVGDRTSLNTTSKHHRKWVRDGSSWHTLQRHRKGVTGVTSTCSTPPTGSSAPKIELVHIRSIQHCRRWIRQMEFSTLQQHRKKARNGTWLNKWEWRESSLKYDSRAEISVLNYNYSILLPHISDSLECRTICENMYGVQVIVIGYATDVTLIVYVHRCT